MAELRRFAHAQDVAQAAADEFVRLARRAISARGRFAVALSGGSTPRATYELLAGPSQLSQLDGSKIDWFWGDERAVPPDHPASNFRMASDALLSKLPLQTSRIHRIEAERGDLEEAAADYERALRRTLGEARPGRPPSLDLALLGMGPDGHTASLFPYTSALDESERWVVANSVPQLDTWRVTLTAPVFNQAANVIFVVVGAEKAATLAAVLDGPPDPRRLPSQLIQPHQRSPIWLVDEAAAQQLS